MTFECRQCGSCCMYLGDYIVIEQQIGPYEYTACCVSTGTQFTALIDNDKWEIFSDHSFIIKHPEACPFLRPWHDRIVCTIHQTSPPQCKAYRCILFQVLSEDGTVIGKVTGTLALHSENSDLRAVWDDIERTISRYPEEAEPQIKLFLEERGYRCIG
jgi:Fe-S-cluster containining protein